MTRIVACSLLSALKKLGPQSADQLARQCLTEASNIREWLYALEKTDPPIVKRTRRTQRGKSSGRSTYYWELT